MGYVTPLTMWIVGEAHLNVRSICTLNRLGDDVRFNNMNISNVSSLMDEHSEYLARI